MYPLFEELYPAELGPFMLRLHSGAAFVRTEHNGAETTLLTLGHEVTVRRPLVPTNWLPPGMSVSSAAAWAFYLQKRNGAQEELTFSIRLAKPDPTVIEAGPDTGQFLTAIEFASSSQQVHIGTQDEDWYAGQAENGQWVPKRLQTELANHRLIVSTIEADGISTQVPLLREGEQFYFHYIIAESPRRKAVDFPQEWDISTWFCVEQTREKLEEAWRHTGARNA